jgi:hypothetical protein
MVLGGIPAETVKQDFPFIGTLLKKNQDIDIFNRYKNRGMR